MCGPVTYNITVMPSHGMMMMINDTVYNITGLNYNTNYIITIYATNSHGGHGEPATITVRTKYPPPGDATYLHIQKLLCSYIASQQHNIIIYYNILMVMHAYPNYL